MSFKNLVFIFVATYAMLSVGVETGVVPEDFVDRIEKSFQDFERSKLHQQHQLIEPACGKPIILNEGPPMAQYDRAFLLAAKSEFEAIRTKAPHLVKMIEDYATVRREVEAGKNGFGG
jgi:hypothetical protein